ncbi:MAG TPA: DUF5947 family protein, partial [Acidimicrobiales bacterium]|nr:DUF5947 family protein [Acidimicrobiales bacterium]
MTLGPATAGRADGPGVDGGPLGVLARFRQPAPSPGEQCEMCVEPIASEHAHVVDMVDRSLVCTCRACYLLFTNRGAGAGRYRIVPDRYRIVTDFELTPSQWTSLQIPVAVAFFFENSALEATAAFFPSPAGATECLLPLDTWREVEATNPILATLEPDVEAALVRVDGDAGGGVECFLVPIDSCYELVGHLRTLWRGFDGGSQVHQAMADYF